VAFGLGLTVLLLLTIVRTDLLDGWRQTLDEDAPNHFMINIQPQERESVANIYRSAGIEPPEFVPLVRARMSTINDVSVKDREYPDPGGRWMANREANLSFAATLSSSNELLEGEWWPEDYDGPPLVSVEEEAAVETGLTLGDRLVFNVAGRDVEATIASIRKINWDSFQPNFFMVFSPGALDGMPTTYIASLRLAPEERGDALVAPFRFDDVPDGEYRLQLNFADPLHWWPHELVVRPPARGLELRERAPGTLLDVQLEATDEVTGEGLAAAQVWVAGRDGQPPVPGRHESYAAIVVPRGVPFTWATDFIRWKSPRSRVLSVK
jgi:hypothetical protein